MPSRAIQNILPVIADICKNGLMCYDIGVIFCVGPACAAFIHFIYELFAVFFWLSSRHSLSRDPAGFAFVFILSILSSCKS